MLGKSCKFRRAVTVAAALAAMSTCAFAANVYVSADFAGTEDGSESAPWNTIQEGIDNAVDGDTIVIGAGNYSGTFNVDGRSDLTITGTPGQTAINAPTLSNFDAFGITTARKAAIRVADSSNISISGISLDMDSVKGNQVYSVLVANSTGIVFDEMAIANNNHATSVTEYGFYVRADAAPYTTSNRATTEIKNSELLNLGRVHIQSHDAVHVTVLNNIIGKTIDDFGYGVDISSESTGEIIGNEIFGFRTRAASDGSAASGVYISNAFTNDIVTQTDKVVIVQGNDIHDCMTGVTIGNQWPGYAGNVDITVSLIGNNIHDNSEVVPSGWLTGNESYGILVTDVGNAAGSSVTLIATGNNIADNGEYGVFHYGLGDSNVTSNFVGNIITGHDVGFQIAEFGDSSSSAHSVTLTGNSFTDNDVAVANDETYSTGESVNASGNWWGDPSGPGAGVTGDVVADLPLGIDPLVPVLTSIDAPPMTADSEISVGFVGSNFNGIVLAESVNFVDNVTTLSLTGSESGVNYTLTSGDGPKTVYAKLLYFGNESGVASGNVLLDTTAPTSTATAVAGTVIGNVLAVDFVTADSGAGASETRLYVKTPSGSSFADSGLAGEVGTSGTFYYVASEEGIHEFATVATDFVGNTGAAPSVAQTTVVNNSVSGTDLTLPFSAADVSRVFPMTAALNVAVSFDAVLSSGTLTVEHSADDSAAQLLGYSPTKLVGQKWSIVAGGSLSFDQATVTFDYDETLLGVGLTEATIDMVIVDNGGVVTSHTTPNVVVDTVNNTITITGVTSIDGTWYAGNIDADVDDWNVLD